MSIDSHYGEHGACIKCQTDVEFVGIELSDFEKQYGSHGDHHGWWDRGGNYSCPEGGFHESTGSGEDPEFFEMTKRSSTTPAKES